VIEQLYHGQKVSSDFWFSDAGWAGIRVSYGLCGIIVPDSDVQALALYLEERQVQSPECSPELCGNTKRF
jgi:hypothetical protein